MDFSLSDEQKAFQEMARNFTEKEIMPHADRWDEEARFCLQGAAGRKGEVGDVLILMFFALAKERETKGFAPRIVRMNEANEIIEVIR